MEPAPAHGKAPAKLLRPRVRTCWKTSGHPGLAGSRNTGIVAADTELVAFCDDDDRWLPGKLRPLVAALAAAPEATLACCGIFLKYGETVVTRGHPAPTVTFRELLRSRLMALHVSSFVARRTALMNGIAGAREPGL
jgi:glycosyltransferase involved in cell wall biosynthesis